MSITLFSDTPLRTEDTQWTLTLGLYPDNTPVVDLETPWNYSGGQFKAILVRPDSMAEFFTAMMVVDSIRERGGYVTDLILPCIPGQRQDRMKWEGDWLMTLRFVAKTINGMNFKRVVAMDPHSLASQMIDRLVIPRWNAGHYLSEMNRNNYDAVIAPDAGAASRAQAVADLLKVPVIQASKKRDPKTNKLSGFHVHTSEVNQLGYSHVLVVDDLCDAGGTFVGLAEELDGLRCTADLFVTHGLFSKGAPARLATVYKNIYTTDSIDARHEGVNYIFKTEGLVN